MPIASKLPEWLPEHIYAYAVHLIGKADLNSTEPLLLRLVTHDKMKGVWKTLSKKATDQQQLIDFLEFVRLHHALEGKPKEAINIPSDNSQRIVFNNIDKLVKLLLNELRGLSPIRDEEDGWRMLESTLSRAEFHFVSQSEPEALKKFMDIKHLQSLLVSTQQQQSIVGTLESISLAAQYAETAPDAQLPVRRSSERAKVNWLIQELKRYLNNHFHTESPSMIANIVNVAFNLSSDAVNDDDVRKLKL
ncbi:MAG: hypothetical protein Q7V02_03145 [Methylophilus sp.]|nr:hypothetical protein [Methylophilus sp.]